MQIKLPDWAWKKKNTIFWEFFLWNLEDVANGNCWDLYCTTYYGVKKAEDEDDDDCRSFVHIFPLRGYI